jgi:hypothetical protein
MKDEDQSYLWMMQHHIEALVTLLDMNIRHKLLEPKAASEFINFKSTQSETIWEEEIWKKVADILSNEPQESGSNVFQFSPDLRGPDT